jgi:hypothetical protein
MAHTTQSNNNTAFDTNQMVDALFDKPRSPPTPPVQAWGSFYW